jgi:hypothetical protein
MRRGITALAIVALSHSVWGAEMLVKAPETATSYDWTGFYAGAHLDYQAAHSG